MPTIQPENIPLSSFCLFAETRNASNIYPCYGLFDATFGSSGRHFKWGERQLLVYFLTAEHGTIISSTADDRPIGFFSDSWNDNVFYRVLDEHYIIIDEETIFSLKYI